LPRTYFSGREGIIKIAHLKRGGGGEESFTFTGGRLNERNTTGDGPLPIGKGRKAIIKGKCGIFNLPKGQRSPNVWERERGGGFSFQEGEHATLRYTKFWEGKKLRPGRESAIKWQGGDLP